MNRNRHLYILFITTTIITGLATRKIHGLLPEFIQSYAGDILWALMVYLILGFIFTKKSSLWIASGTIMFSFAIEISQLYHTPWIDSIRNTTLGGLVLGFGFLWSDLLCYSAGTSIGFLLETLFRKKYDKKKY